MTQSLLTRRKQVDLLATTGALVAGLGAGAIAARALAPLAVMLLIVGGIAHAIGMTGRHRIDRAMGPLPGWFRALYWLCWFVIAAVAVVLLSDPVAQG
jgi:hypothetical protein